MGGMLKGGQMGGADLILTADPSASIRLYHARDDQHDHHDANATRRRVTYERLCGHVGNAPMRRRISTIRGMVPKIFITSAWVVRTFLSRQPSSTQLGTLAKRQYQCLDSASHMPNAKIAA